MSPQIHRTIKILSWLSAGERLSTQQIIDRLRAGEHGAVTQRSIQRYIASIRDAGVPVLDRREGNVTIYYLEKGAHLNVNGAASASPLLSLHLLKAALPQFKSLDLEALVAERLQEEHGDVDAEVFSADLIATTTFGEYIGMSQPDPDILDQLIRAIVDKQWIIVTYRKGKKHEVFPHRLIPYRGRLYLACKMAERNSYMTLSVDQIRSVKTLKNTGPTPKFSIDAFMRDRFGLWTGTPVCKVRISFGEEIHHEIATRRWHPTQEIRQREDGRYEISFTTGLGPELKSWVLHWTPHLVVEEPVQLKREIADLHRASSEAR